MSKGQKNNPDVAKKAREKFYAKNKGITQTISMYNAEMIKKKI